MPVAPVEVALVNMPFGPAFRPSLALAQLAALLRVRGVSVRVMDFTIRLAEWIGHDAYAQFSNQRPLPADRVGDWIFAGALFGPADTAREEMYLDGILRRHNPYYGTTVGVSEKRVTSEVFIENVRVLRGAASSARMISCSRSRSLSASTSPNRLCAGAGLPWHHALPLPPTRLNE